MNAVRNVPGLGAVLLLCGCHSYVPTTTQAMPVGSHFRAMMSTEAQVALRDRIGYDSQFVEGRLVEAVGDSLLFSVRTSTSSREFGRQSFYQRLDVLRGDILRVDMRKADIVRTGVVVGMVAGGATLAVLQAFGDPGGGTDNPNGITPEERVTRWILSVPSIRR